MSVLIQTSVGDISIDLYTDEAPLTCYNFLALCHLKFYNNCLFHSVEKGFVCRAGNPATAAPTWGLGLPQHLQQQNESDAHIDDGGCSIWGLRHLQETRQLDIHRKLRQHKLSQQALHHDQKMQQKLHPTLPQSYEPLMLGSVFADIHFSSLQFGRFPTEVAASAVRVSTEPASTVAGVPSSRFCPYEARDRKMQIGLIGMLPNAAGKAPGGASAFFITLGAGDTSLVEKTTVFGEVAEGREVLEKINFAFVDEKHVPLTPIRILRVYVLHDPFFMRPRQTSRRRDKELAPLEKNPKSAEALTAKHGCTPLEFDSSVNKGEKEGDEEEVEEELDVSLLGIDPVPSPPPLEEEVKSDEEVDELQQVEKLCQKEAEARKVTLEILGDLPTADAAPPENVLFVAKLNPATRDEDLKIIFARFGDVVSCDIIRDHRTGASLQYAFVAFKEKEQCEKAYFKMQNVLVDDRRIHVDFSQSVSREWRAYQQQKLDSALKAARPSSNHGKLLAVAEQPVPPHEFPRGFWSPGDSRNAQYDNAREDSKCKQEQIAERQRGERVDHVKKREASSTRDRRADDRRDLHSSPYKEHEWSGHLTVGRSFKQHAEDARGNYGWSDRRKEDIDRRRNGREQRDERRRRRSRSR